ncbi:fimbria/pilus periplasmic chaperone [Escherichia albertii]|uniref:fimbria/pilus periplasmic chaperone n=1 Tax=Escherichia albertii TaxID=208962 RepID=UPI000743FEB1|nr:fimbria/pilus periplasmic chaperone [Escherichia albertii]EHK6580887.1 fimbria/pilus periplasmic chaperone [Escherichia albertii]EHW5858751.1 fimbria/pilus periplasmic chaperone [Escherichia albertii]MCU7301933.1 fimbria/pilus periplasmic chaperone [Escherichia albertii]MCZ8929818.1 fimbria/pilus periplasmic chaperone [Escherichia albertii]MCZ8988779.1 fimbria/pilus periplasmic chaperone [Escherichia albertii]
MHSLQPSTTLGAALMLLLTAASLPAQASVTPDRTRLIFNESDNSISVTLRNNDPKSPYLAQSWLEDAKGNKISSPLAVLPPVQRIDAMMNGQVKVQGLPDIHNLPADRESMFYFNVREIPPKSNTPNTLQIALQTRIKLFWRPKALEKVDMRNPWQYKVTLTRAGQTFTVNNPTPYYVILSNAGAKNDGSTAAGFSPLVILPQTSQPLKVKMDSVPVLTYVNDYGARLPLFFHCAGDTCSVDDAQSRKG